LVYGSETPYRADTAVEPVSLAKPISDTLSRSDDNTVYVKKIVISGNVRVATAVLQKTVQEDEQRTYTYAKLEDLLTKINYKYKSLGFEKARAVILEQEIKNATLNIYITTDQELAINPIRLLLPKKPVLKSSTESTVSRESSVALIVPKNEIKPLPLSKTEPQALKTEPITIGSLLNEQTPQTQKIDGVPRDASPATKSVKPQVKPTYTNYKIEKPVVPMIPIEQTSIELSKPISENILQESASEAIPSAEKNEESSFSIDNVLLFATNALLLVLSIGFVF
jgi:hypothetical protein